MGLARHSGMSLLHPVLVMATVMPVRGIVAIAFASMEESPRRRTTIGQ